MLILCGKLLLFMFLGGLNKLDYFQIEGLVYFSAFVHQLFKGIPIIVLKYRTYFGTSHSLK